jgi:hypothetical protein
MMRSLLFEGANATSRGYGETERQRVATVGDSAERKRVGRRTAKVAVARKLAVILYRIWRDGSEFRPAPAGWSSAMRQATS